MITAFLMVIQKVLKSGKRQILSVIFVKGYKMSEPIDFFLIRIRKERRETKKLIKLTNKFMKNYSEEDQKRVKSFVNILEEYVIKLDKLDKELD